MALSEYRLRTDLMLTSASPIAVVTVRKVPVIACTPILYTLFIVAIVETPQVCIQIFKA